MRIGDRPHLVVNKTDGGLPSNPSRTRSALLLNERPILAIIFGHAFGWNVSGSKPFLDAFEYRHPHHWISKHSPQNASDYAAVFRMNAAVRGSQSKTAPKQRQMSALM